MLRQISSRFWQFLCEELSFYTAKGFCYSYAWSCSLCEGRMSFCTGLSLENSTDSYLCFQLALLHSVSYFFSSIDHLLRLYTQILMPFHLIQTRFSRSAHLLMSYLIDITRIVNFPNRIPDCDSHSPVLLDFLFFWRCICSTIVSLHWETLIMLSQFPLTFRQTQNSMPQQDAPFYRIAYDYFRAEFMVFVIIWEMFHGRISLEISLWSFEWCSMGGYL